MLNSLLTAKMRSIEPRRVAEKMSSQAAVLQKKRIICTFRHLCAIFCVVCLKIPSLHKAIFYFFTWIFFLLFDFWRGHLQSCKGNLLNIFYRIFSNCLLFFCCFSFFFLAKMFLFLLVRRGRFSCQNQINKIIGNYFIFAVTLEYTPQFVLKIYKLYQKTKCARTNIIDEQCCLLDKG